MSKDGPLAERVNTIFIIKFIHLNCNIAIEIQLFLACKCYAEMPEMEDTPTEPNLSKKRTTKQRRVIYLLNTKKRLSQTGQLDIHCKIVCGRSMLGRNDTE